jgi:hypothetical protein
LYIHIAISGGYNIVNIINQLIIPMIDPLSIKDQYSQYIYDQRSIININLTINRSKHISIAYDISYIVSIFRRLDEFFKFLIGRLASAKISYNAMYSHIS